MRTRENSARASISRVAALAAALVTLFFVVACGGVDTLSPNLDAAATRSVVTLSAASAPVDSAPPDGAFGAQTQGVSSLHERVMAEHRPTDAPAPNQSSTAASSSPPQPGATTSTAPLPEEQDSPTTVVLGGGQTSLKGVWGGTAEQLAVYLLEMCPAPRFTVSPWELADYYVSYCSEAGLRADLLWAQMIKETGYGMYGGDVLPEQNNYAGIGATGGGAPGIYFPTAEAGVMAHVAHMVAYVYSSSPVWWADGITDPRFDLVYPRGVASILADLNGRWAVPGISYGESIEAIARAINAS